MTENQEKAEAQQILRERARRLARRRAADTADIRGIEVFEFIVAGDHYALPVAALREVHPARRMDTIPGTPDFVAGVVVIRGQIVSVLDLRVLLGLGSTQFNDENYAVVLGNETMNFALMAHQVGGVRVLEDQELEAGNPSRAHVEHPYVSGVTGDGLILLDGEKLLSDPALVVMA